MCKRFRIEHVRANIPTSQGTIYPEEVMQRAVDEANKRAEEGILLAYVHVPGDTSARMQDALGLVTCVALVYGWIEIEIKPISIEGKFNPLNDDQFDRIFAALHTYINLAEDGRQDFSIEIDPRKLPTIRIENLAKLGINRLSIGVQDFDPMVQIAVNRIRQALKDDGQR